MRMLKLEIDALAVESFHTAAAADARGTVHAAQDGFVAFGAEECTVPSDDSWCPILSCGSSCDPETVPVPTGPDQPTG